MKGKRKFRFLFFALILSFNHCGIFDTSVFNKTGDFLDLSGKWQFYHGDDLRLKNPGFVAGDQIREIQIPGRYHRQGLDKVNRYSWLRRIFVLEQVPQHALAVFLGEIKSIDETYLNGELIGASGSADGQVNQAFDKRRFYLLPSVHLKQGKNLIAIRTFEPPPQSKGGIKADKVFIDRFDVIQEAETRRNLFNAIWATVVAVLGLVFLLVYRGFPKSKELMYFGLLSLFLGMYLFFYGQLKYLFSDHFLTIKKIEYFFLMPQPALFISFTLHLVAQKKNLFYRVFTGFGYILTIVVLFVPNAFLLMQVLKIWQVYLILCGVYGIIFLMPAKLKDSNENRYYFAAILFFAMFVLIDLARALNMHSLPKLLAIGGAGFLAISSSVLVVRLRRINRSLSEQIKQLWKIADSSVSGSDYLQIAEAYHRILSFHLGCLDTIVTLFDPDNKAFSYHNTDKNMSQGIREMYVHGEPDNLIPAFKHSMKLWFTGIHKVRKKHSFFFLNVYHPADQSIKRGYICGFIDQRRNPTFYWQLLRIIRNQVNSFVAIADTGHHLEQVNLKLEDKVKLRTLQLQKKNAQLLQMNRVRTEFFTNITHDIKTPLSLITIPVELLIDKYSENIEDLKTLERIRYNTYRIIGMINSLLDAARLESRKAAKNFIYDDITAFIKKISMMYEDTFRGSDMALQMHMPIEPVYTSFDPEKIEKIMANLLSNAYKHNRKNKPVIVSLKRTSTHFIISIKDHGRGIKADQQKDLFNRFVQLSDVKGISRTGSGLGLSIVKDYVKMHQGKIKVNSEEHKFTEFILNMPLLPESRATTDQKRFEENLYITAQHNEMHRSEIELKKIENDESEVYDFKDQKVVFYIGKNKDVKDMINDITADAYRFVFFNYPVTREKLFSHTVPDIILIELQQIGADEFNFVEKVKTYIQFKYLPMVVITSENKRHQINNLLQRSVDEVLVQPFHPEELRLKLHNLLMQKALRLEMRENYNNLLNELNEAKDLLEKNLPDVKKIKTDFFIDVVFEPANITGGDFFDIVTRENSVAGMVIDVSGHGVASAMIALSAAHAFREAAQEHFDNPAGIITKMNKEIYQIAGDRFVSAFVFYIDNDGNAGYSSAAHPVALLKKGNRFESLKKTGPLLGLSDKSRFDGRSIKFKPGAALFIYTDGLTEAGSSKAKKNKNFSLTEIKKVLRQNPRLPTQQVYKRLKEKTGENFYAEDDITMVYISSKDRPI